MAIFIKNPEVIEAVKWDGTPEGAEEIKKLIEKAGYFTGGFVMEYDEFGVPAKNESYIRWYYRSSEKPKPGDDVKWEKIVLGTWTAYNPDSYPKIRSHANALETQYTEVSRITPETLESWAAKVKEKID